MASRSMLEALLARVQKRAQEPRVRVPPLPVPDIAAAAAEHEEDEQGGAEHEGADTLPPQGASAALDASARAQPPSLEPVADDDDIEEYDEELIEIIDDADVIPQAAAAARAIEPAAFGANLERRGAVANGKATGAPPATAAARAPAAPTAPPVASVPAAAAHAAAGPPALPSEPLRPESVAARPVATAAVVHTRGVRRELRATPFLELLDASLKLGS